MAMRRPAALPGERGAGGVEVVWGDDGEDWRDRVSITEGGNAIELPRFVPVNERQLVPYVCPVCFGKGIVCNGFYSSVGPTRGSTSTAPEPCRACGGTGIVWG